MEKFKKNIKQKFIVCTIAYAVMFSAALILSMLTAFEILIPVTGDAAFCGGLIGGGAVMLSHALNYRKGLKNEEKLKCHYCNKEMSFPDYCPQCGSDALSNSGSGTQKIEILVKELFPEYRVERIDSDILTKKNAFFNKVNQNCVRLLKSVRYCFMSSLILKLSIALRTVLFCVSGSGRPCSIIGIIASGCFARAVAKYQATIILT